MNKLSLLLLFSLIFSITVQAQEWGTDLAKAKTDAIDQDRNIILVFQGSDWCAPCIKLERNVWSTDTFKTFAKENLVLLKADFPRRKKNRQSKEVKAQNRALAEKYNDEGIFPMVVILDKEGKVLGKTGYKKMKAEEYIKLLNSYQTK